jgi:predicted nucleotidyltransferase
MEEIKKDFAFLKGRVQGVLLFGSRASATADKRSDIDICLVGPREKEVILEVFQRLGGKYDVKVFEDLPLTVKMEVIKNHRTIIGNEVDLSYYFYRFRKEWGDVEARIRENRFTSGTEMIRRRRAWRNERQVSQKA